MSELLRVEQVSKHFDGTQALEQVSLDVAAGEVHALVGENGAGKSTLGKVIAGVVRPDSGGIFIDGRRAELRNPLDAQRHGIGIIWSASRSRKGRDRHADHERQGAQRYAKHRLQIWCECRLDGR